MGESSNTQEDKNVESATSQGHQRAIVTIPLTALVVSATRPIVTIIFAAVIADSVVNSNEPPQWFLSLAIPVIVWWFGERAYRHSKERNGLRER